MTAHVTTGQIFDLAKDEKSKRARYIPIIDRAGNLLTEYLNEHQEKTGASLIRLVDGDVYLSKVAKDAGYVLYEDMCKGRLEGIEASTHHWLVYEALGVEVAANRIPEPGALTLDEMWHPEVVRRLGAFTNGAERIPRAAMQEWLEKIRAKGDEMEDVSDEQAEDLGMTVEPKKKLNELMGRKVV